MAILTQPAAGLISAARDYRRTAFIEDEFMSGGVTTTTVGSLGWIFSSGATAAQSAEANHPGIIKRSTGAASGTNAFTYLGPGSTNTTFLGSSQFDLVWVFRLNNNDAFTAFMVGVGLTTQADLIVLEKAAADTNFFCRTRTSSNQTKTDTNVAVDTNWHSVRIKRTATQAAFWFDNALVATNTAHLTTAAITPFCLITNSEAADKSIDLDYFSLSLDVVR